MTKFLSHRTVWILLVMTLALLLSACSSSSTTNTSTPAKDSPAAPADKTVRIALFGAVKANAYEQARTQGAVDKGKELNAEVQYFSAEYDSLTQINQIQDAVTSGKYDAFVVQAIDSTAVVPILETALKKGIKVIGTEAPIGPNTKSLEPYPAGVSAMIGRTGNDTGIWLGNATVEACKGKDPCKVAYLIGMQALTSDQERYAAFQETIKAHSNIKVVAFQEGAYRQDQSYTVMQNVFQANPDLNVVLSSGDQMTLGAEKAATEAKITGVAFIGNGGSKQGCEAVQEGRWFATIADIPYTQGELDVVAAVAAVRGQPLKTSINLNEQSPPLPAGGPVINQKNVTEFKCQW